MADIFTTLRERSASRAPRHSVRAVLAVGGAAALAAVGIVQTAGTMAAQTDSATANVSQIATQNFFPTPLTTSVTCTTEYPGGITSRRANVSWAAVPGATGYILELVKKGTTTPTVQTYTLTAPTTSQGGIRDSGRDVLYGRVRTVNNGAVSSGYMVTAEQISYKDLVSGRTECEGTSGASNLANFTWENTSSFTPAAPQFLGRAIPNRSVAGQREESPAESVPESTETTTESAKPGGESTTAAPETTTESAGPESTTPESTTPESTTTRPSTTQPSTTQSKPSAEEINASPSASAATQTQANDDEAQVTIAITVSGEGRTLTVQRDGVDQCTTPLEDGDVPSVNGTAVAISNGGSVKTVNTTTCAVR